MKTKYALAKAKPIGHQMEAQRKEFSPEAVEYAVSEFFGARVE